MKRVLTAPRAIRGIALLTAVLLAPLLSFGAASLLDMQKGSVTKVPAAKLVKVTPAEPAEALSDDLVQQIAAAIAMAEMPR